MAKKKAVIVNEDVRINVKVPGELLRNFKKACESRDMTMSQELRAYMRDYLKKHGQGELKL